VFASGQVYASVTVRVGQMCCSSFTGIFIGKGVRRRPPTLPP
jgi:hypothetical protein